MKKSLYLLPEEDLFSEGGWVTIYYTLHRICGFIFHAKKLLSANKSRVEFLVDKQQWEMAKCRAKIRVGQGFWVYGIQGLFKSGIRYIAA